MTDRGSKSSESRSDPERTRSSGQGELVARRALEKGLVTEADLAECRSEARRLAERGQQLDLGQILLRLRKLRSEEYVAIRQEISGTGRSTPTPEVRVRPGSRTGTPAVPAAGTPAGAPAGTPAGKKSTDVQKIRLPRPALPSPVEGEGVPWGDYEILSEIARGGMGIVYRARQKSLGRIVALKILREGTAADDEQVTRFRREAALVGRLRHSGIVTVHDAGVHEGFHYFSMDFVEGEALDRLLARGPIDAGRAMEILVEVARAVDHAHGMGVIHRDLKPGNILLDSEGRPLVTDFGLAKLLGADESTGPTSLTQSGTAMGTPFYMSPEQARGSAKAVDRRSDVFSLGVILYEMLAGQVPFRAESKVALYQVIQKEDAVPPRRVRPEVPRDAETICLKALEKDPARRYPTARELAEDLERARRGEPILARPISPATRVLRALRRYRTALALGLLSVAAAGSLASALALFSEKENGDSAPAGGGVKPDLSSLQEAGWEEILHDSFERKELGETWTPISGHWEVRNGCLVGGGISECAIRFSQPVTGDLVLEYRARKIPKRVASDLSAFVFGKTANPQPWLAGYFVGFGSNYNTRSYFRREQVLVWDSFTSVFTPGRWHRIKVSRDGQIVRLEVDGAEALVYEDFFPLGDKDHNVLGFYTFDSDSEFDDVRILRKEMAQLVSPLKVADDLYRIGEYAAAQGRYEEFAHAHPDSPEANEASYKSSLCVLAAGDHAGAIRAFRALATECPDPRIAERGLLHEAQVLVEHVDQAQGLAKIREFLDARPGGPGAPLFRRYLLQIAESLALREKKYGEGLPFFREALARHAGERARAAWLERQIALCLLEMGLFDESIQAARGVQEKYPDRRGEGAWAGELIGIALRRQGRLDEAIAEYGRTVDEYLSDDPVPCVLSQNSIAEILENAGQGEDALAAYKKVVEEFWDVQRGQLLRALKRIRELGRQLHKPQEALDSCYEILRLFPQERAECAEALLAAGDICFENQRIGEANDHWKRILADYRDQSAVHDQAVARLAGSGG
ncbi:MAG: protein kinase [Planctomycetes bacterium]|nr:protein kinase [Planctomycetota bacterium]